MLNYFNFKKLNSYHCFILFFVVIQTLACKKNESAPKQVPTEIIADSIFQIVKTSKFDINDFEIYYQLKPPPGVTYYNLKLHWSSSPNFETSDSTQLRYSFSGLIESMHVLKRLKQSSTYFVRLSLLHKNKTYYSEIKEFRTDTLKFMKLPPSISRGVRSELQTNFTAANNTSDSSTRIYLDNIPCTIEFTNGEKTQFVPPTNLSAKKYSLRFERNGISIQSPDSIDVTIGQWSEITPPSIPLLGFPNNGIGYYCSCFSNEKGYIVPGVYFRQIQLPPTDPNYGRPGYILEFNGSTGQWTKKTPTNPMYFESPICHYANNAIYVISGATVAITNGDYKKIQRMLKFDLNTLTWSTLDSLPYPEIFNMVSFEYNNEFYIGLGADGNNQNNSGIALQSKQFWKYNPNRNTWTKLPDFPGAHEFNQVNPTAFVVGSKAFVFYGAIPIGDQFEKVNLRQELWEFDLLKNSWTKLSLPQTGVLPFGEKYQIFTYNNKAYFLTAQRSVLQALGYGFWPQQAFLEFDPQLGTFKPNISPRQDLGILKLVYKNSNKFYFQSDAFGYTDSIPNRTFLLTMD